MKDNALRRLRKRMALTQEELAERAKVSQFVVSHLERGGVVGRITAIKLYKALNRKLDLGWLLGMRSSASNKPAA